MEDAAASRLIYFITPKSNNNFSRIKLVLLKIPEMKIKRKLNVVSLII